MDVEQKTYFITLNIANKSGSARSLEWRQKLQKWPAYLREILIANSSWKRRGKRLNHRIIKRKRNGLEWFDAIYSTQFYR